MPHTVWQNPVIDSFRRAMPAWLGAQVDGGKGPAPRLVVLAPAVGC